jgi:hypothetical protein
VTGHHEVVVPQPFRPGEFLKSPKLAVCHDDANYLVGLILMKTTRGQVDEDDFGRLRSEYLRKVMNQRRFTARSTQSIFLCN